MRMTYLLLRHTPSVSRCYCAHPGSLCLWKTCSPAGPRRRSHLLQPARCISTLDDSVGSDSSTDQFFSMIERCRALVLDSSYRPINVINWQRAICLDFLDKVDVLEYYNVGVQSASTEYLIPAVLRVRLYVKREIKGGRLSLSRRNIMIRDMWTCQYCGVKHDLTLDHVQPTSAGGQWSWENLVTACTACNGKKGNKPLEQLGWTLRRQPVEPSAYEFGILLGLEMGVKETPKEWSDYLLPLKRVAPAQKPY